MAQPKKIARRSFFAGLGVLAAAGLAAKFSARPLAPDAPAAPAEPQGKGYRISEHVKKYYRSTMI